MRYVRWDMRIGRIAAVSALAAVLFLQIFPEKLWASAQEGPGELYAMSAVLMDGETGRVLYEKEGDTPRPNASTTKVMTCILALENAQTEEVVTVSQRAASQPDVQLNIREGEQYYLKDLLYSLMLKSHNDTAVAIAEHIGGTVESFAVLMNKKAEAIGCRNTHFITPNGLDARDSAGAHRTTARDLALIMRYAVKNQEFLKITETRSYSFSDLSGKRNFSVQNTNALLDMVEGVISGKTGYTGEAGYCYVCAWKKDGKTFVVSLLGCGWPGNKTYKWRDAKALLKYGEKNYRYREIWKIPEAQPVLVTEGAAGLGEKVYLQGKCRVTAEEKKQKLLMREGEEVTARIRLPKAVAAPVKKGQKLGELTFWIGEELISSYPVTAEKSVRKLTYGWYVEKVFHDFFHR